MKKAKNTNNFTPVSDVLFSEKYMFFNVSLFT